MFIECRHCHTIYRIDEKKIPSQESFVKCSKCLSPITLKTEEKLVSSRALNKNIVECPECKARYLIFSEKVREKSAKVRCGGCDHVFILSSSIIGKNLDEEKSLSLLNDSYFQEESASAGAKSDARTTSADKPVSEENKENAGNGKEQKDSGQDMENNISKTALEYYLEAVSLDSREGKEDETNSDIDPIPSEQKNKIFLKAYSKQSGSAPDTPNKDAKETKTDEPSTAKDDIEEKPPADDKNEKLDDPENKELSQGEQPEKHANGKRKLILAGVIALILALLGVGGWFFFKNKLLNTSFPPPSAPASNAKRSGLVIMEPLKGRYAANENEGKIFVIEGKVVNYYPENVKISYLQIEGSLYNQYNKEIEESNVYAGNILYEEELRKWTGKEIKSFLSNKLGRNNINLAIDSKQKISFQVIFFNVPKNIYKIGAKISDFSKKEL